MSNVLDPDQDRRSVGPDLSPNCLQRLSTVSTKVAASKSRKEIISNKSIDFDLITNIIVIIATNRKSQVFRIDPSSTWIFLDSYFNVR